VLERVGLQVGYPKAIRVDQGSEFVSRAGKPTDDASMGLVTVGENQAGQISNNNANVHAQTYCNL
jgi:hypothetical protein